MKTRHHLAATATALTLATGALACGNHSSDTPGTIPGQPPAHSSTALKDTDWFTKTFGTPLLAANTTLKPRAVEQAHDLNGTALPQNSAPLDGPAMWQRVQCEALPFSTTDGPTKMRANTIYGGFARTPFGATLAAYHLRNFGGTATERQALPAIVAPADRDRVVPVLKIDQTDIPARNANCLATNGIRRPARYHTEAVSDTVIDVSFWYLPESGKPRGSTFDVTVVWSGDDWYLTEQSILDIGYSGRQKTPTDADEPAGWATW